MTANTQTIISDALGNRFRLSETVFEIQNSVHPSRGYKKGDKVQLISGIDGMDTLGYHFNPEFVTVCRVGAKNAEFCGIRKKSLRLV